MISPPSQSELYLFRDYYLELYGTIMVGAATPRDSSLRPVPELWMCYRRPRVNRARAGAYAF